MSMNNSAIIIPVSFKLPEKLSQQKKSQFIKVGEVKPQAPNGEYIAKCVHVEPNWKFLGNRKVAVYLEVSEGENEGKVARLFYPLRKLHDDNYDIAPKSKLMKDIKRMFPEYFGKGEIDPVELFQDKFFYIKVEKCMSKDGEFNSIVKEIALNDVGF